MLLSYPVCCHMVRQHFSSMAKNPFTSLFKKRNREFSSFNQAPSYSTPMNTPKKKFGLGRIKFSKQLLVLLIIALVAVAGFAFWFKNASSNIKSSAQANSDKQEEITPPYATHQLDREFSFPLRNEKSEKVAEFKYIVQNAELTREIVVKGQKASAVKGRTFLVLNLKINNDGKQKIQVNSRDYIRLMVNGNDKELLAPDIHNDPVEVQPISTKFTRLGFAINDTDKNLKVQIGEIDAPKQYIDLTF